MNSQLKSADEDLLADWLLEWEDSQSTSTPKSPEIIAAGRPDLLAELRARIAALAEINRLILAPNDRAMSGDSQPSDSGPKTRHDALFGRLAVLTGFVEQLALDDAVSQQRTAPFQSLADILVQRGTISEKTRQILEMLLDEYAAKPSPSPLPASATESQGCKNTDDTVNNVPNPVEKKLSHKRFGEYELLAEIARGGMGVVYKARQNKLNRLVALKMIRSGELADEGQVKRFYSEAEAAAKLDHPGIVPVYEVGEANGQHFFSMALVVGASLNELVKNDGPLAPKKAAHLLRQVVESVEYAHGKGIIHRDIKPQNILIDEAGQPRLTDFGLAKQVMGQSDLTATGQVMGTPSYMPPEQATGKLDEIGPASDVYSLGATLYFVLTGRPPFQTASTMETIRQVLNSEPVSLRRLNPALPRDLETICLKCLRKETAKRYATAGELAADLGCWLENMPITARPVGPAERAWLWCKRRPTLVLMSLLLVVLALAGTFLALERQNATRARARVEALLVAPPQGVPHAVEDLTSVQWHSLPILRQRLAEETRDASQRLHAAVALASFGEVDVPFLVASIPQAQAGECTNIVTALRGDLAGAIIQLRAQFAAATKSNDRLRLAVVLLQLGEVEPSQKFLTLASDPSQRTLFIHHLHEWRGNLADYAPLLKESDDADFQSGLCQAIGQIPVTDLSVDERQALDPILKSLFASSPHGSVHSAARWTLQQWKLELPKLTAADPAKSGGNWYVNPLGMTFLKIPSGSFERQAEDGSGKKTTVTLSRAFWLGDCEVSRKQFEAFVADPNYPLAEKPEDRKITIPPSAPPAIPAAGWPTPRGFPKTIQIPTPRLEPGKEGSLVLSPNTDYPVNRYWFDACLFCNWLSHREGLSPSYERTGDTGKIGNGFDWDVWRIVSEATGYRLPTKAEWEYACRAKSATNYCFGDDESLLGHYAIYFTDRTQPVSSRQPNGWGLFDMHGNVWEWNDDWDGPLASKPNPGQNYVLRGGSFADPAPNVRSAYRVNYQPTYSIEFLGFRVARALPPVPLTALPPTADGGRNPSVKKIEGRKDREFPPRLSDNLAFKPTTSLFPKATASHTSQYDKQERVNDGIINYKKEAFNRWTSYESTNPTDWLEIEFAQATAFSRVQLAIYDEGPQGGVQPPLSYTVEIWNGEEWLAIPDQKRLPEKPTGNDWNEVRFKNVTAKKVRVVFTHNGVARSGITEIAIWP